MSSLRAIAKQPSVANSPDVSQGLEQLRNLSHRDCTVLKAIALLVPKASVADLIKLSRELPRYLDDTREAIRREALTTLSFIFVYHPEYTHTLDERNAGNVSKEMVAFIKMRERQAMLQASAKNNTTSIETISHSNLKTILNRYKTKSWYGQCFDVLGWLFGFATPYQSRVILEMHQLLAMKKLIYTKDDIEAVLSKDTQNHAQYRLRLFRHEVVRRQSGTDDIVHALGQKFQYS